MNRNILPIHILLVFIASFPIVNISLRATSFVEIIKKNKIKFSALGLTIGIIGAGAYTYVKNKLDKPEEITDEALTLRIETFHDVTSNSFYIRENQSYNYIQKLLEYCVDNVAINATSLNETLNPAIYQQVEKNVNDYIKKNNLAIRMLVDQGTDFDKDLLYQYIAGYLFVVQKTEFPYKNEKNVFIGTSNTPLNLLVKDDFTIQNSIHLLYREDIPTYKDIVDELKEYPIAYQFAITWQLWRKEKQWQLPTAYIPLHQLPKNNIKSEDLEEKKSNDQKGDGKPDTPEEITSEMLTLRIKTLYNVTSNSFYIEHKKSGKYIQKLLEYCVKNIAINVDTIKETLDQKVYKNIEKRINTYIEKNNLVIKIEYRENNLFDKDLLYQYIAGYLFVIKKTPFPYKNKENDSNYTFNTPLNLLVLDDFTKKNSINVLHGEDITTYKMIVNELRDGIHQIAYQFATTWQLWRQKKQWQLPKKYNCKPLFPQYIEDDLEEKENNNQKDNGKLDEIEEIGSEASTIRINFFTPIPENNIKSKDIIQQTDIVQKTDIVEN